MKYGKGNTRNNIIRKKVQFLRSDVHFLFSLYFSKLLVYWGMG